MRPEQATPVGKGRQAQLPSTAGGGRRPAPLPGAREKGVSSSPCLLSLLRSLRRSYTSCPGFAWQKNSTEQMRKRPQSQWLSCLGRCLSLRVWTGLEAMGAALQAAYKDADVGGER